MMQCLVYTMSIKHTGLENKDVGPPDTAQLSQSLSEESLELEEEEEDVSCFLFFCFFL